ncbi:Mitochondrial inner membrane protein oxa1l, partial [Xenoophorus captivus]
PVMQQVADVAPVAADILQAVAAEPRLAELGLAGYTPVGLIQSLLEFFHMDLGLPWWGAIVVGTVLARLAVFPVIVKGQREAAKLNNVLPEMTKLTNRMNEAKQSGNKYECTLSPYFLLSFCHCCPAHSDPMGHCLQLPKRTLI